MKNISIILLSTLMLSNVAWGEPILQPTTNSLSKAALEINAMNAPPQTQLKTARISRHESEKNNSLFRAVLAIQQANMKVGVDNELHYSQTRAAPRQYYSFYGTVLEKQFSRYK